MSELVTNSLLHSGLSGHGEIVVTAARTPKAVRIEVCDEGIGFKEASAAGQRVDGGHGLDIIAAISTNWGVHSDGFTAAWFSYTLAA
ncbi:MAG: ATP-binding protein [Solirubrobacterales bacterium]|nr:ATP-binding protein [Solirubrobacterales bacterium]